MTNCLSIVPNCRLLVVVLPLGIHGEPSLQNPFPLCEQFTDTPEGRGAEHPEKRRQIDVGHEKGRHATADADEQIDDPGTGAPVILGLDDDRVPDANGEKGHRGDGNACEIHNQSFVFGCEFTKFPSKNQRKT